MKLRTMLAAAAVAAVFSVDSVAHDEAYPFGCYASSFAGRWMFATGVGRQMLGGPFPPDKDITAIGTFTLDTAGALEGVFDVTVQDAMFLPDLTYTGSLIVNRDCTGTLTFVTSAGSSRTDSVVIVNHKEMLAMSQDPNNLWTYQMRRLGR